MATPEAKKKKDILAIQALFMGTENKWFFPIGDNGEIISQEGPLVTWDHENADKKIDLCIKHTQA